jgi:hypothetical protein
MSEDVRRLRVDNCIGFLWELLEKMTRRILLIQPRAVDDFIRSLRTVQKNLTTQVAPSTPYALSSSATRPTQ